MTIEDDGGDPGIELSLCLGWTVPEEYALEETLDNSWRVPLVALVKAKLEVGLKDVWTGVELARVDMAASTVQYHEEAEEYQFQ